MCNAATIARLGRARLACIAGLVLVILSASLGEAAYGPRINFGQSYQQWSNTQSPDGIIEGLCSNDSICNLVFQKAPALNALIVQHVSCVVTLSAGGLRYGDLRNREGQVLIFHRHTYLTAVDPTGSAWVVNSPVMHLVRPGERPVITFHSSAAANWVIGCSIPGKLQRL